MEREQESGMGGGVGVWGGWDSVPARRYGDGGK